MLGFAPRTHLSGKYWIIIFFLGGRPANFRKKLKMQEENLWKIHKTSLASAGSAPWTPRSDKTFNYSYIFVQLGAKKSWNFCKVIKFSITDFDKFPEIFSTFGGLRPPSPHYSMSILDSFFPINKTFWPARKLKRFLKILHFFSNFLNIFSIFY